MIQRALSPKMFNFEVRIHSVRQRFSAHSNSVVSPKSSNLIGHEHADEISVVSSSFKVKKFKLYFVDSS